MAPLSAGVPFFLPVYYPYLFVCLLSPLSAGNCSSWHGTCLTAEACCCPCLLAWLVCNYCVMGRGNRRHQSSTNYRAEHTPLRPAAAAAARGRHRPCGHRILVSSSCSSSLGSFINISVSICIIALAIVGGLVAYGKVR